MALSEHEQRLLDQLEASLAADDPSLAHLLRGTSSHRVQPRRATVAAVGLVAGLAGLVGGLQVHPLVSVLGFVVMLMSLTYGLGAWSRSSSELHRVSDSHPSRQSVNAQVRRPTRRDQEPGTR